MEAWTDKEMKWYMLRTIEKINERMEAEDDERLERILERFAENVRFDLCYRILSKYAAVDRKLDLMKVLMREAEATFASEKK